jgi:arylsulfatase
MQEVVQQSIADFAKFPPRQKPASFNLDAVLAQVTAVPAPHNGKAASKPQGSGSTAKAPAKVAAKAR